MSKLRLWKDSHIKFQRKDSLIEKNIRKIRPENIKHNHTE